MMMMARMIIITTTTIIAIIVWKAAPSNIPSITSITCITGTRPQTRKLKAADPQPDPKTSPKTQHFVANVDQHNVDPIFVNQPTIWFFDPWKKCPAVKSIPFKTNRGKQKIFISANERGVEPQMWFKEYLNRQLRSLFSVHSPKSSNSD